LTVCIGVHDGGERAAVMSVSTARDHVGGEVARLELPAVGQPGAHAQGFYDRYRQGSASPWTEQQHPCPHFG